MKKVIEIEYPDFSVQRELVGFLESLTNEEGEMKEGVYKSHIIIEWVPNN